MHNLFHKHKCPECSFVWGHNPTEFVNDLQHEQEHYCPMCLTQQKVVYFETPTERTQFVQTMVTIRETLNNATGRITGSLNIYRRINYGQRKLAQTY